MEHESSATNREGWFKKTVPLQLKGGNKQRYLPPVSNWKVETDYQEMKIVVKKKRRSQISVGLSDLLGF